MNEDYKVLGAKFLLLAGNQSTWSQKTFGTDAERGPLGALKHLEKEARECQQAVGTEEIRLELADCFLLLIDAGRRAGFSPMDLVEAALEKQRVNIQDRTWSAPIDGEPVEHVREA